MSLWYKPMVRRSRNLYLDEEDLKLIEEPPEGYTDEPGTLISQAAMVAITVRRLAKENG
jgi:hypothetical protein